ncbi:glutamine amidotransferase [Candidatus Levyibacteriota bacterium]|nr:hypothetical protein [Candidatus Levybacteria bacterium]GDX61933.1 glutamine amidotransferase [Candidatus Levybacteria bacterium]
MKKKIKYSLIIGWLYPELMSTYGDRGNIISLSKRCEWRDIDIEIRKLEIGFKIKDLIECNILFMGGAQDKQQEIVSTDLTKDKINSISKMIENNIPGLYICGAYQLLGKYYKKADGDIIQGLKIFDIYTENLEINAKRLVGDIIINPTIDDLKSNTLVGFENHGGRTYLGNNISPLGIVTFGFGNNGIDKTEGAIYKNSFGTYFHGPILPKNPHLADLIIKKALEIKYHKIIKLIPLDDSLEFEAHNYILNKLNH